MAKPALVITLHLSLLWSVLSGGVTGASKRLGLRSGVEKESVYMTSLATTERGLSGKAGDGRQGHLNLAIYYPWLYLKSGGERTILELTTRSRHKWTIITNRYERDATYPGLKSVPIIELESVSVKRTFREVLRSARQIVAQKLPLDGFDAVLVFSDGLGDLIAFRNAGQIPMACYCFTPLRAAFDELYQARYLAMTGNSPLRRSVLRVGGAVFRGIDRLAWKRYDHIFVISQEVTRRILKTKLCAPEKMSLLYAGIDYSAFQGERRFEPFFLIPGRIMWTKNTELGLRSFLEFKARRPEFAHFKLIIAGFVDAKSEPYVARLREVAGTRNDVEFRIDPPDVELFKLYRNCYAVIYTPFNEDMGLIPVEAMAAGKPVLTVDCGGPREIVRHGRNGFLLDQNPAEFARVMEELAGNPDLTHKIGAAGREHARSFDWIRFHQTIDNYFDRLVS